jgi:hypothetical protein
MVFVSDNSSLRTFDPDSNWELICLRHGREYITFELRHPSSPPIQFWGEITRWEGTGRRREDGGDEVSWAFLVLSLNNQIPAHASQFKRKLIENALNAYGTVHNGPIGPLEVTFRSSWY